MGFMPLSSTSLIVAIVIFTVSEIGLVAWRFWSRHKDKLEYKTDDYLSLAAGVTFIIVWTVPVIILATQGGGDTTQRLPNGTYEPPSRLFNQAEFAPLVLQPIVVGLARCSILFFYRRIFISRDMMIATTMILCFTVAWMITFTLVLLLRCIPVTIHVVVVGGGEKCIDSFKALYAMAITGVINDLACLILPLPAVLRLKLHRKQRLGVLLVFLLGNLTIACSIVRTVYLFDLLSQRTLGKLDVRYSNGVNDFWAAFEACTAIMSGCIPCLGRYLRKRFPAYIKSVVSSMTAFCHSRLHISNHRLLSGSTLNTLERRHTSSTTNAGHPHSSRSSAAVVPVTVGLGKDVEKFAGEACDEVRYPT